MSETHFPFDRYLSIDKKTIPSEILNKFNKNNNLKEIKLKHGKDKLSTEQTQLAIQEELRSLIPSVKYEEYFKNQLIFEQQDSETATFSIPHEHAKTVILTQFYDQLESVIKHVFGKTLAIQINVKSEDHAPIAERPRRSASDVKFSLDLNTTKSDQASKADSLYLEHLNSPALEMMIDPKKTFQSFVVGPSNNMAFSAAKAVAKEPGKRGSYPTLYIYSGSGLGKTHLLHAVANEVKESYPELVICLISAKEFITEMIEAVQNNSMSDFMRRYTDRVDLLMIDDIHEIKNKETTQDLIFDIFNMLHKKGKQLIFTSDMDPSKIVGISERLKTRLSWGLVIDIQKPDLETRIAILKRKATEFDLYLSDDILNLIAMSVRSSIRELEGTLIKLHAYITHMGIDIDYELAKRLLNLESAQEQKVVTLETVAKATSQYFRITVADLKSKSRKKEVALARHVGMFLSRKIVNATLDEIGKFYGGRDHSSVLHAEKSILERSKSDGFLAKDILYIENNL